MTTFQAPILRTVTEKEKNGNHGNSKANSRCLARCGSQLCAPIGRAYGKKESPKQRQLEHSNLSVLRMIRSLALVSPDVLTKESCGMALLSC